MFVTTAKIAATAIAISSAGCGHGAGGKLTVDTPALPYHAPDIDEITGIDPDAPASGSGATNSGEQE
jgi:hypothetical protein